MTETVCRQGLELSDFELLLWNWKLISVGHGPQFVTNSNTPNCFILGWIHAFIIVFEFMEPWATCQASPVFWFIQLNEAKNPPCTFHILLWPFDLLWFVLLSVTPTFRINLSYPCQLYLHLSCSVILSASYYHFVYIYLLLLIPYLCRDLDNAISSWNAK